MERSDQKLSVLIIDDDPNNLKVVVDTLIAYGFRVLVARTGERGLQRAERLSPDLILLDVNLPGIDGFEVCRRLRTNELTRRSPVIFMTAHAGEDDKIRGFDVGAVDYVTKPVSERELLARLRTQIEVRDLSEEIESQRRLIADQAEQIAELRARLRAQSDAPSDAPSETPRLPRVNPFEGLSKRQRQVVALLVAGRANKEIAYELSLSQTTVSTHRARILDRLGIEGLSELVKLALEHGLET